MDYVESLVKIANLPSVIKRIEPNIAFPMKVEEWQVRRILEAQILFKEEYDRWTLAKKQK